MNLEPLQDRIIVERITPEEMSKGGIIIPENAKEKPQQGKVVAIGKGRILDNGIRQPMEISVGNVILFGKYAGSEIMVEEREYLILRQDDVMGIVRTAVK